MLGFLGSYKHKLDKKGRVSLPVPFRRGREGSPFVLIRTHSDSLSLYPEDGWIEVQQELRELARKAPELRHQVLGVTAEAIEVSPDAQGRILIPAGMREAVGLEQRALLVGAINHVEIWDPDSFLEATSTPDAAFDNHIATVFA